MAQKSIWQSTRKSRFSAAPLQGSTSAEVVIVGAGISGLTLALKLIEEGKDVAVIEAKSVIGEGTTSMNSAHLTSLPDARLATLEQRFDRSIAKEVAQLAVTAINHIEQRVEELGIDCSFERVSGFYYTEDASKTSDIWEEADAAERAGLGVKRNTEIPLPFAIEAGFEVTNQAQFHPLNYVEGLARAFADKGGRLYCDTCVTDSTRLDPKTKLDVQVGDEEFDVTAEHVVWATHTPVGRYAVHAALPGFRSYMLGVKLRGATFNGLFWDNEDPYHYSRQFITPEGEAIWLVGGADHKTGDGDESSSLDDLKEYLEERYDVLEYAYEWSAQWYEPTDGLPMIGVLPSSPGQYAITGLHGDGLTWGTWGALSIASDILTGKFLSDTFTPARASLMTTTDFLKASANTSRNMLLDRVAPKSSLAELAPGEGGVVRHNGQNVVAFKSEDGHVCAFSATCPHMKGMLKYNNHERSFDCPCHGQRFDLQGQPIEGPSASPLEEIDLSSSATGQ